MAKKNPKRSCLGCKSKKDKKELLRIVRTKKGEIRVDLSGKISGRGAYVCLKANCIKEVFKGKRLAKALRKEITVKEKEDLIKEVNKTKQNEKE